MCELLAISSSTPRNLNHILETFYKRSPGHPHGWGIGLFSDYDRIIEKEPIRAIDSKRLKEILSRPLEYNTALGHIRYATTGEMIPENTHPFQLSDASNREWVLMHNGTIINAPQLEIYKNIQNGDTDSERILLYLIDKINQKIDELGRDLSPDERFDIVDSVLSEIAKKENKLNIMIYDGEQLYTHSNGKSQMYYSTGDGKTIISTCPLETESKWQEIPIMRVHAFRNGELIRVGEEHGKEYIPNPELESYLYNKYAHLTTQGP